MLEIRPVETEGDAHLFDNLPYRLYSGSPYWVPPLRAAEASVFVRGRNPALDFCDVCRWVAIDDGRCVGRVAAIINPLWNKKQSSRVGRFSRFEVEERPDAAHELLRHAEEWLSRRGMESAAGPLGFSNLDQQGFTTLGFDREAALGSSLTKPYYVEIIEAEGYEPLQDWSEYKVSVPQKTPERISVIANAARRKFGLGLVEIKSVDDIRKCATAVMDLFNVAFDPLFGTYSFNDALKKYYIDKYIDLLDPRLVVAVEDRRAAGRPLAGFMIAIPSVTKALRKAKGSLGFLDLCNIWFQRRNPTEAEILLAAVRPEARRRGAFSLLIETMLDGFRSRGITSVETTAILEGNDRASSIIKNFEHERHKLKRCYIKAL